MDRPLYNQLVSYYEIVEGRDWRSEIDLIASILKGHGSKSLVDLGCGTGYHVRALSRLGFEATGIDISKQNIRFARENAGLERGNASFVVGSYYDYHPAENCDAALCLNWSIPVKDSEVKRFLRNTHSLLQTGGLLIFDFERASEIVWDDVGKPITELWDLGGKVIVRVSVGRIVSNVLRSRDFYIVYSKFPESSRPNERSRYQLSRRRADAQLYVDNSYVRFFSMSEIRDFARDSRFRVIGNFVLPRKKYKRNYVVLKKIG